MLKVSNKKCIRHLSYQAMKISKSRNIIAILAIALTTVLFTSLFTIAISINDGVQQANFRQSGGFAHATFKNMSEEQYDTIKNDKLFKEVGLRRFIGMAKEVPFNKSQVEIGYSDSVQAHWMFCDPVEGRLPKEGTNEAATDLRVLELLGVEPEIGAKFTMTFDVDGKTTTQTFTLCGWWEYDPVIIANHVLIPESRVDAILNEMKVGFPAKDGMTGSWGLDVMFKNSLHIQEDVNQALKNHGFQSEEPSKEENFIAIGVNWAYIGAQISDSIDFETILTLVIILLLIIFTGYLIIYNVFQISVSNDIRFYGLLKTIGTTPKQIKRILRNQALMLSVVGIPIGWFLGWCIGTKLTPVIVARLEGIYNAVSVNPLIFVGAALFSLLTILLSCNRPGRLAAKVSPIEAVRYTEGGNVKAKTKKTGEVSLLSMAKANLGRSRSKTIVTILSLSLAIILLTITVTFTNGFDIDKYVSKFSCSDFVVANARYFQVNLGFSQDTDSALSKEVLDELDHLGKKKEGGRIYGQTSAVEEFISEEHHRLAMEGWATPEEIDNSIKFMEKNEEGLLADSVQLYGMENFALNKLHLVEGDISKLLKSGTRYIAAVYLADDYGNLIHNTNWAKVGDTVTLRYVEEYEYYYVDTGEIIENFDEKIMDGDRAWNTRAKVYQEIEYEVAAVVSVPYTLSYRYFGENEFVLNADTFIQDTGTDTIMLYTFDTTDENADEFETFLADYTENVDPTIDYESKNFYITEFENFRSMFLLLGSALSFIVGMVGILNFFNAILTSIISRKREFSVLQSIGMTGRQLKRMLVYEGVFYAAGSVAVSSVLILISSPLLAPVLESIFWFFSYHFTIAPILILTPVFVLLGCVVPLIVYRYIAKATIVERLREV